MALRATQHNPWPWRLRAAFTPLPVMGVEAFFCAFAAALLGRWV